MKINSFSISAVSRAILVTVACSSFSSLAFAENKADSQVDKPIGKAAAAEPVPLQTPVVANTTAIEGDFKAAYLDKVVLPEGFKISVYADDVPGARSMALSDEGTLYVGTRGRRESAKRLGSVYAVVDNDNDFKADKVIELASELFMPNGVAVRDGALYVAEPNRLLRYDDIENSLDKLPEPVVVNDSYPSDIHHGWKYIGFGPDDRIYLPVGAPCNICEADEQYSVITSIKPDGSDKRTVARGVRNTVGFDWHPETKELWFTENGRDLWSDDMPPEELNRVSEEGQHFGFPYEYGKGHRDNVFEVPEETLTHAALELPAHTAPLGMKFYTGDMFPKRYKNNILIPHHGSWNRSEPAGYYISFVELDGNEPKQHVEFASGWLQDDGYWGRPTDLLQMPDGSLLVSDDHAGVIYRITYEAPQTAGLQ